MFNNIPHWY